MSGMIDARDGECRRPPPRWWPPRPLATLLANDLQTGPDLIRLQRRSAKELSDALGQHPVEYRRTTRRGPARRWSERACHHCFQFAAVGGRVNALPPWIAGGDHSVAHYRTACPRASQHHIASRTRQTWGCQSSHICAVRRAARSYRNSRVAERRKLPHSGHPSRTSNSLLGPVCPVAPPTPASSRAIALDA